MALDSRLQAANENGAALATPPAASSGSHYESPRLCRGIITCSTRNNGYCIHTFGPMPRCFPTLRADQPARSVLRLSVSPCKQPADHPLTSLAHRRLAGRSRSALALLTSLQAVIRAKILVITPGRERPGSKCLVSGTSDSLSAPPGALASLGGESGSRVPPQRCVSEEAQPASADH